MHPRSAPRSTTTAARRRLLALALPLALAGCSGDDGETGASTTQATATQTTAGTSTTTDATMTGQGSETTTSGASGSTSGSTSTSTSGSSSSTSTDGSTSDATTTSGGGGAGLCQEACDGDGDCLVDGVDQGFVCQEGRCRPGGKPDKCNNDLFCQIVVAGQLSFCESTDACSNGRACVALDGFSQGSCAPLADGMGACFDEDVYDAVTLPLLEGDEALVCVASMTFCDPIGGIPQLFNCNALPAPCRSNDDCDVDPSRPICGGDGACVCNDDAHCQDVLGQPHCVDGRCACTSDAECDAFASADACVDGVCGCSSAAVCPAMTYYDGTEIVCEPL